MNSDSFAECSLPVFIFRDPCLNDLIENSNLASFCSARLQAGICSRCPPEGGRYRNQDRVLAARLKKETLEANLGDKVKFPVTFTLILNLSGIGSHAIQELFAIKFVQFTGACGLGACGLLANVPIMRC